MRYLMLLAFSVYALSVSAGQEQGGPIRRPLNDAERLEYLKKELSFSEWRSTTKDGLRIQVNDPKDVVRFPPDFVVKLRWDDLAESSYEVEGNRRGRDGGQETIRIRVSCHPSLEAAHEALLARLLHSSAPTSWLKGLRSRQVPYGDVHIGPGSWARGNLVFSCTGATQPILEEEVFAFIDKELTKWALRMQDLERHFGFQEWAGQVRLRGMEVRNLSLAAPDFGGFLRASVVSSFNGAADVRVVPQAGPPMDLRIVVCDSPLSAQKRVIRGLECVDSAAPDVAKAERGGEYDLGDACFYPPSYLSIDFARNNVAVTVRGGAGDDPADLLRLAAMLDAKVVTSLVNVGAGSGAYGIQVDLPKEAVKKGQEILQTPAATPPVAKGAGAQAVSPGDHKPGSYVLAIEEEVKPFALVRQGRNLWPSARKGPGRQELELTWGVTQDWSRPNEEGSVSLLACSFADEQAAERAAQTYSVSMAAIFQEGGILGESFGNRSWHSGDNALVFSRGRFAFSVITPGIKVEDQPLILVLFARALDKRAQEATTSASPWGLAAERGTPDASMPPPKAPGSGGFDPEASEAVLKGMSPEEARKYALEQAQKLADNPDAEPEKLRFFLRGLGPDEDPPQVRVLRQILRGTANDKVRAECLCVLGQWVTDSAEVRDDALRTLTEHLGDGDPRVRADAARAFGCSGDVRRLPVVARMLGDPAPGVRGQAAQAVCELLSWECCTPAGEKEAEAWQADLQERLKPILEAVSSFEKVAGSIIPPGAAPAAPEK